MKDDDIVSNQSNNRSFEAVIEARLSRRGFLGGGLATAATVALGGVSALLKAVPASAKTRGGPLLGFQSIPVSTADTVVVPPGYTARVLIAWGDPVSNGPALHPGETADESPNDPANPKKFSNWPDGDAGGRPRSSCIVITKDDGGRIGS